MDKTLAVINSLEADGIIERYAIGGAVGLLFYAEPTTTFDLDIFCYLPKQLGVLIDRGPLYAHLATRGCKPDGEHMIVEDIPVQFLIPSTDLVKEALETALAKTFAGVPTRVFAYEHLLAIMVETGRPKDRARIAEVLESAEPDRAKLNDILKRHNLLDKWSKIVT